MVKVQTPKQKEIADVILIVKKIIKYHNKIIKNKTKQIIKIPPNN
jgi:hypothetical protein